MMLFLFLLLPHLSIFIYYHLLITIIYYYFHLLPFIIINYFLLLFIIIYYINYCRLFCCFRLPMPSSVVKFQSLILLSTHRLSRIPQPPWLKVALRFQWLRRRNSGSRWRNFYCQQQQHYILVDVLDNNDDDLYNYKCLNYF